MHGPVNATRGQPQGQDRCVPSGPTDDSFEVLAQVDHQVKGMSIADHESVRFCDGYDRGNTSTPKRPGAYRCQVPENVSQIPEVENMQAGRQHLLSYQEDLKKSLLLVVVEFQKCEHLK